MPTFNQTSSPILPGKEEEYIYQARMNSNAGIIHKNVDTVASFWLDSITVVSGEGGQYSGKRKLIKIWKELFAQDGPLFERLPQEILVGESGLLGWESGIWRYTSEEKAAGKYAAMWRKTKGVWMTQSELFVSLDQ